MSPKRNRKTRNSFVQNAQVSNSSSSSSPRDPSQASYRSGQDSSRQGITRGSGKAPMQAQAQEPYPPRAQHNRRNSIVLPPGKDDLEVLENLKQIIKNGQHDFYKAIPQPAALASLYLGKIPAIEQPSKPTAQEDRERPASHQTESTAQPAASPDIPGGRPPRLQGKDGWEAGSLRRGSMSNVEEKKEISNGYRKPLPEGPSSSMRSVISESAPSALPGVDASPRNVPNPRGTRPSASGYPENIPASDDSTTAVSSSPAKIAPSPAAERMDLRDRDHAYIPRVESNGHPAPYPRDDKQSDRAPRYRRDSYARPNDRYPRHSGDSWRPPPEQRPYKPIHDNPPRGPYVKAEEVPISLSDLEYRAPPSSGRHPGPLSGPAPASSQNHARNVNGISPNGRSLAGDVTSLQNEGRGAPSNVTDPTTPSHRLPSNFSQFTFTGSSSDASAFKPRIDSYRMDRDSISKPANSQGNRPIGGGPPLDYATPMAPPHKSNSFPPARQPEKYTRQGSPGFNTSNVNNGLPRTPLTNTDRDDIRGPPKGPALRDYKHQSKDFPRDRDYRPPPGGTSYRPDYDDRRVDRIIDVDDPRYSDDRHYRAPPSPPPLNADRQRPTHRFPPSPRTASGELPYDASPGRRYSGPPPTSGNGAPRDPRDWYPSQPSGSYQRWDDDPYYRGRPANWDPALDRDRFDSETSRRGWDGRADRDPRDSYRGPPPASAPVEDRYLPPRDLDRGRPRPPPSPPAQIPPSYTARVRPRSPSPIRPDTRPPLKRARDEYSGPPPPSGPDYYPPQLPSSVRDSIRRPSDDYHPSRGATPPPPSTTSTAFYDTRNGPPPSSASTVLSGDRDREREFVRPRDSSAMDYRSAHTTHAHAHAHPSLPPPPHSASSYDRPPPPSRSSPPPPSGGGGGGGRLPTGPGYARGGYSRPPLDRNVRDRPAYHAPPSRP